MDIAYYLVIFIIGFIGAYLSGLLGIGGAIINYPMLLYMPRIIGFESLSAYEVSGVVAIQVFIATLSGTLGYRKSSYLKRSLILYMAPSVFFGSLFGSLLSSKYLSETGINVVYGTLAIIAIIMMLIPTKEKPEEDIKYPKWLAMVLIFFVGVGAGIIGAGGAFLLMPIMLVVLSVPLRVAIASSLAITFISSIGTAIGKLSTGQVPIMETLIIVVASVIAAQMGVATGKRINVKTLRMVLSCLIIGTALKIWMDLLIS